MKKNLLQNLKSKELLTSNMNCLKGGRRPFFGLGVMLGTTLGGIIAQNMSTPPDRSKRKGYMDRTSIERARRKGEIIVTDYGA